MPAEFHTTRMVRFAETDMAGVMHFSNYLRIMEEVEHAFWRSLGVSVMRSHEGTPIGWPRASVACEYFSPCRFEDELDCTLKLTDIGERSLSHEVLFKCQGRRIALGRATAVCCALQGESFKPIPIPGDIRSLLESFANQT